MAVRGLSRMLNRSYAAAVDPCSKARPFQTCTGLYSPQTRSDVYASTRCAERYRPWWNATGPGMQLLQIDRSGQSVRTMLKSRGNPLHFFAGSVLANRAFSSHAGDKQDAPLNAAVDAASNKGADSGGSDWGEMLNHARQMAESATAFVGDKAKDISGEVGAYVQDLYASHPYLESVIVPVGGTLSAAMVAWFIMPSIFRRIHKYTVSPFASLSGSSLEEPASYEKSLWHALEDPARYLTTFLAFSQLGVMIAPTTSEYLPQAWRGAAVLSFVWFLQRWKTNFFSHAMANRATVGLDRDKLVALEKVSSVGLLILAVMALAEACGVAVQSILTVGGIGGVATAFAARDILGNVLSGLSVQFSRPFSVGDNIKAGSVEGQVVEMGLTTTSLISPEKFPVIVPNSLFSSQVIVNKSRAQWRASHAKIPVRTDDLELIPRISEEIKSMLRSNPNVFLGKDAPYCYLSKIENSFAELTLGCNLKSMRKDELYAAEQDILLQAAKIIKQHGAELGSTQFDFNNQ